MSIADRLRERVEQWTGYTAVPSERLEAFETMREEFDMFANEAEDLALATMDYAGGRPYEMRAGQRRRTAQESRVALIRDPLAGAEASIRANFAYGKGIPEPKAKDDRVQEILTEAWRDPNNKRKLTSFAALRKRSNQLLTDANLFPVAFTRNGRLKVGFLDADLVYDIVPDPNDDETPLYYVTRRRTYEWDVAADRPKVVGRQFARGGLEKVWYYPHWQNVAEAERAVSEDDMLEPLPVIPPEKIADGLVEHIAINQISRSQFGTPPWARILRFYSALNALTEAQVQMAQGRASIIAKRIRRGGPKDVLKAAGNVLSAVGNVAQSNWGLTNRFGDMASAPSGEGPGTEPQVGQPPPPAASWWVENEADSLQAVNLSSGAAQAAQDAQVVRAPISAATQFGQHWLGDASNANLASASTLELPALMEISAWQEVGEGMLRWFCDLVLDTALHAGRLGGMIRDEDSGDGRPLGDLSVTTDREELEKRTGLDLSYSLQMPYPGRRNLPDVQALVQGIAQFFDPQGQNPKLRRILLDFLFRHGMQLEDPAGMVDEVWPEDYVPSTFPARGTVTPADLSAVQGDAASRAALGLPPAPAQGQNPPDLKGVKTGTAAPQGDMGKPAYAAFPGQMTQMLREAIAADPSLLAQLNGDLDREFAALVADGTALLNGGAPNGNGSGAAGT